MFHPVPATLATRLFSCALSATLLASCSANLPHSAFVDGAPIGYVERVGPGPTVVFEAGLGDGHQSWAPVLGGVSEFAATIAYSRPGYLGSAQVAEGAKRTADDVARRLHGLLQKTATPPPYVMVGHSVGGMYVQRFAKLFPDEVAGIVLVDGRPKGFTEACHAAGLRPCSPPKLLAALQPAHVSAEIRGLDDTDAETPAPTELGDIPVAVIVATEPAPGVPRKNQPTWIDYQKRYADAFENGRYVEAEGSGHYIHRDDPELVVETIQALVDELRN